MLRSRLTLSVFLLAAALISLPGLHSAAFGQGTTDVPQTITSPLGKKMKLIFHDEFDGVTDTDGQLYIDRKKWITSFWQGGNERTLPGNKEAQYYMDKDYAGKKDIPGPIVNPFSFEKPGILTITANRMPEEHWKKYNMKQEIPYTSGLLVSDPFFTFKYGYVEGRFKLPGNKGAWPALWLLGNDPSLGDRAKAHEWPPEIDVFEYMGHWGNKHTSALLVRKGEKSLGLKWHPVEQNISEDFHTWGVEWNEEECAFTFDGKVWIKGKTTESLKRPMYLLINLAVGGRWFSDDMTAAKTPAKPWEVDHASMPWKMECDYIRVYQEQP